MMKPKYKIVAKSTHIKQSNNNFFNMSIMQTIWACVIALFFGMIVGFMTILLAVIIQYFIS